MDRPTIAHKRHDGNDTTALAVYDMTAGVSSPYHSARQEVLGSSGGRRHGSGEGLQASVVGKASCPRHSAGRPISRCYRRHDKCNAVSTSSHELYGQLPLTARQSTRRQILTHWGDGGPRGGHSRDPGSRRGHPKRPPSPESRRVHPSGQDRWTQ